MSSRLPNKHDRFSQMSEQAAIIARKKAEIEAKLKSSSSGNESNTSSDNSRKDFKPTPPGKSSKNRWGFKTKRANDETVSQAQQLSSTPTSPPIEQKSLVFKNTFTNDGNFLEQFKKMKESKATPPVIPKPEIKVETNIMPPAPVATSSKGNPDDWYKSALERAKSIAKSMTKDMAQLQQQQPEPNPNQASSSATTSYAMQNTETIKTETKTEIVSSLDNKIDYELPTHVDELASMVAVSGDHVEEIARSRNVGEQALEFLFYPESEMYQRYRNKVDSLRKGFIDESTSRKEDAQNKPSSSKKKSRWGDESEKVDIAQQPGVLPFLNVGTIPKRSNPQLIQYAIKVFGSTDLEESQWKQCEDQLKMNQVYNELLVKKKQAEIMAQQGKRQYEYDSDEDTEGGTWEHKARKLEMEKTKQKAEELTHSGSGGHHIGDFLPPEELTKFMSKFEAIKSGQEYVEESDYAAQKLKQDNLGFKMLQRMGWNEGTGLGADGQGITAPIGRGQQSADKKGLGVNNPVNLEQGDDEFDAYRKRMMMAYRFRPNPLNNPRRAYY